MLQLTTKPDCTYTFLVHFNIINSKCVKYFKLRRDSCMCCECVFMIKHYKQILHYITALML